MTDIGELEEYVEAHPADHEQRWRLAKKLYKVCEYERALEQLQLIGDELQRRLNVLRYLAATHYRLGQHDEAVRVLERAVQSWPQEIGAREQLARVLEASGRREEAASVWEAVLELDPRHPLARQSVKRLHLQPDQSASAELGLTESDSGIDLTSGWTCTNCGAKNNDEFERCWQCHAAASGVRAPTPRPAPRTPHRPNPWLSTLIIGLVLVVALCWGLFLFLSHLAAMAPGNERVLTDSTFRGLFDQRFFVARAMIALVFFIAWPQIFKGVLALLKVSRVPRANVTLAGFLLAACLYVVLWTSPGMFLYTLLGLAVLSGAVIVGAFRTGFKKSLMVWAVQLGIVAVILFGSILVSVRLSCGAIPPIREAATISDYVQKHDAQDSSFRRLASNVKPPATIPLKWESTGSNWLDAMAKDVVFELVSVPANVTLNIEITEDGNKVYMDQVQAEPSRFPWKVAPGRQYQLLITCSQANVDLNVTVYSVLQTTTTEDSPSN